MRGVDILGVALVVVALIAAPALMPNNYYLGILTVGLIYAIWVASWDFMSGLTGRMNFGQGLAFGIAGYVTALLNTLSGFSPWTNLPICVALAVLIAIVIGFPTLSLRGPYFALATFAALIVIQRLVLNLWQYTGAEEGVSGLSPFFRSRYHTYYFIATVSVCSVALLTWLSRGHLGMILRAIKGDEAACQAAGLNVTFYNILTLSISSAIGAIGGVLYAHSQRHVGPELLSMHLALTIVTMAFLGGMGSIYGGAVAAILLSFGIELLRSFGEWRLAVYAVILLAVLFLMPNGVIQPLWSKIRVVLIRGVANARGR